MQWLLITSVILAQPVLDGGPEKVGDIIDAGTIGIAATEQDCIAAGEATAAIFDRAGNGSVITTFNCIEISLELAREIETAQGFE